MTPDAKESLKKHWDKWKGYYYRFIWILLILIGYGFFANWFLDTWLTHLIGPSGSWLLFILIILGTPVGLAFWLAILIKEIIQKNKYESY